MQSDAFKVPDDPSELRGFVGVLMSELKNRDIRITDLEQRLAGMNRHRFGARSENADQLNLTLENAEIAVSSDVNCPGFTGERLVQMLGCFFIGIQGFIEHLLCFMRRDISNCAVKTLGVVPIDPFQRFPFKLAL